LIGTNVIFSKERRSVDPIDLKNLYQRLGLADGSTAFIKEVEETLDMAGKTIEEKEGIIGAMVEKYIKEAFDRVPCSGIIKGVLMDYYKLYCLYAIKRLFDIVEDWSGEEKAIDIAKETSKSLGIKLKNSPLVYKAPNGKVYPTQLAYLMDEEVLRDVVAGDLDGDL
ncbi:MAG: hypothetical protein NT030_06535, partial [Candidatus Saganbacteria bacterium]|nr:hypothetical protein [Candidatus Saganbacteria bacterium]